MQNYDDAVKVGAKEKKEEGEIVRRVKRSWKSSVRGLECMN
jgi:hypothetical protein